MDAESEHIFLPQHLLAELSQSKPRAQIYMWEVAACHIAVREIADRSPALNYYQHHLGDYLRDTAHLSMVEDGAYHRLLAAYYVREKSLPLDHKDCCKLARASTPAERRAVSYVLEQFFVLESDGYHQKRADEELSEYRSFIAKQRSNGKSGAGKRWDSHRNGGGDGGGYAAGDAAGGSQTIASQLPTPNSQSPIPISNPLTPFEKGASSRNGNGRSEARAERDEAQRAWTELLASHGAKRDARIQAAIDAVGGWSRIQQREQGVDSNIVRKQFCDAFRDYPS